MKTDNQYLREIAKNFGVDVPKEHKPSNWYLKRIKEALEEGEPDE